MKWAEIVACRGGKRHAYGVLVGKQEGKEEAEKLCCSYECNIQTNLSKNKADGM
jgi:hypothetical protein